MWLNPSQLQRLWWPLFFGAGALVIFVCILGVVLGAVNLPFEQLLRAVLGEADAQTQLILTQIRLPRVILALSIGVILALSGAVTQGLFRNPLADPSLIGVTAGASAGASIVIVLLSQIQWAVWGLSLVSLGAFFGGLLAVLFVYRLATGINGTSVATMLLAGIAITFLTGSFSSLLEFFADDEMLRQISLWRMGGLDAADYPRALLASLQAVVLCVVLPRYAQALNALLLGESEARHLGVDIHRIKLGLIIWVALAVGVAVALAGTIAFVGLVVPHMVRLMVGPDHRYLIPLSALGGGFILVVADLLSRIIIAPTELPVGILTAAIGAPIFISLLRHRHAFAMRGE